MSNRYSNINWGATDVIFDNETSQYKDLDRDSKFWCCNAILMPAYASDEDYSKLGIKRNDPRVIVKPELTKWLNIHAKALAATVKPLVEKNPNQLELFV